MAGATQAKGGGTVAEEMYFATAEEYHRERSNEQCDKWVRLLSQFSPQEIRSALDDWECDITPEFNGKPRGSRMPDATEILALIGERKRLLAQARKFKACNSCDNGWVRQKDEKGNDAVKPCQCRVDWIAAQKAS